MANDDRIPIRQPLTFSGVAALACGDWFRLAGFQLLSAGVAGLCVIVALARTWSPVVSQAIEKLPPGVAIRDAQLQWPDAEPVRLGESRAFSIVVAPEDNHNLGQVADVQFEFTRERLKMRSLLGFMALSYPMDGKEILLSQTRLHPWWGAWRPAVLAGAGAATMFALFVSWAGLAALYAVPVRAFSFLADRDAAWFAAWKLGSAAMLPGAWLFSVGILAYGILPMPLPTLLFIGAIHLVLGWIYLVGGACCLPKLEAVAKAKRNPFSST